MTDATAPPLPTPKEKALAAGIELRPFAMARRQRMIGSEKRSQQVTAAHSSSQHRIEIAVISLASHRAIQEPSACHFIVKNGHSTVTACCNLLWNSLGSDNFLGSAIDRLKCEPRGVIPLPDCENELDTGSEPFSIFCVCGRRTG